MRIRCWPSAAATLSPRRRRPAPDIAGGDRLGRLELRRDHEFRQQHTGPAPQFSVPGTIAGDIVSIYADGTLIGSATATSQTTVVVGNGKTAMTTGVHQFTARQGPYGGEGVDSPATPISILASPPGLAGRRRVRHFVQLHRHGGRSAGPRRRRAHRGDPTRWENPRRGRRVVAG